MTLFDNQAFLIYEIIQTAVKTKIIRWLTVRRTHFLIPIGSKFYLDLHHEKVIKLSVIIQKVQVDIASNETYFEAALFPVQKIQTNLFEEKTYKFVRFFTRKVLKKIRT